VGSATTVTWLLTSLVVSRISLVVHELGHALVALRQTSGPVLVQVGKRDRAAQISLGRLHMSLALEGSGGVCFMRPDRRLSRGDQHKRVLAGPAVNLVLALLFGALALRTYGLVRVGCLSACLTNAAMTVINLTPHHARGTVNAGRPARPSGR
jgi:Zn-dependent protease